MRTLPVLLFSMLVLAGCSTSDSPPKSALEVVSPDRRSNEVVNHGKIENIEKWESFVENVKAGKTDQIRFGMA
ncbi:DUF4362 domain-containing protein [Effusibacillus consociatus]|uniref:DUF4362 domain-containing protein n=1 Tax=Effusibacillus consociatus TaxID=1117041 RepID=A0ABV9PZK0_9BACL